MTNASERTLEKPVVKRTWLPFKKNILPIHYVYAIYLSSNCPRPPPRTTEPDLFSGNFVCVNFPRIRFKKFKIRTFLNFAFSIH